MHLTRNGPDDIQSRLPQESLNLTGRKGPRVRGVPHAFQPVICCGGRLVFRRNQVDHGDLPARTADTHHLGDRSARILEVVNRKATDDQIKDIVRIR